MKAGIFSLSLLAFLLIACDSDPLGVSVQNDTSNTVKVIVDDGQYSFEIPPKTTRDILLGINYDPQSFVIEEQSKPLRRFTVDFRHAINGFGRAHIKIE